MTLDAVTSEANKALDARIKGDDADGQQGQNIQLACYSSSCRTRVL